MFPSFLDGLARTTPPESLEPVREVPTADASFEAHLQRPQDASQAKVSDDGPVASDAEDSVHAGQFESNQADQEGAQNASDDEPRREHAEAPSDQESNDDETGATGVRSAASVEALGDAKPRTELETTEPSEAPDEEASPEDNTAIVAVTNDEAEIRSTESRDQEKWVRPDGTNEGQQRAAAKPVIVENRSDNAGGKEPAEASSSTNQPDTLATTSPDGVVSSSSIDGAHAEGKTAKTGDHAETAPSVTVESAAVGKQALAAIEAVAGRISTQRETKGETTAEVDNVSPPPAAAEGKSDAVATSPQDRFAQQLMTGGGERASRSPAAGDINQTRFVDRVARAFRATEGQGGTVKLRLHPPELGMLQVQLKVQGNVLTAKLEAETPAARALLVDSLPILRDRLAEQGIRIEQFDIDLMERHPQSQPDGTGERPAGERNADGPSPLETGDGETIPDEPGLTVEGDKQQLNIIV